MTDAALSPSRASAAANPWLVAAGSFIYRECDILGQSSTFNDYKPVSLTRDDRNTT
jgi:hypothetical protein